MKRSLKNLFIFVSINLKIIISVLFVLIGVAFIFVAFKSCYEDAILAIGSGIFSSAFITFIFEIINRKKESKEILKSLQELNNQIQAYNHRITQCYNCLKSVSSTNNLALQKNLLFTESYKIILIGNILLNEINKFKFNYFSCVNKRIVELLNSTYIEVEENMSFITSASSNSTSNFNIEMLLNKTIRDNIELLRSFFRNKKSIYYQTKNN